MVRELIHQHRECQDMAGHEKYQKYQLPNTEELPRESAEKYPSRIAHAMDLGVSQFHSSKNVAGIPSYT